MRPSISRRDFIAGVSLLPASVRAASAKPPAPYDPLPTERQLRWHELDYYAFIHFGPNTFTDKEWGYGDEDPAVFNPTTFDADAIAEALKAGGMAGAILTAKHHDGFCLWPTETTEYCIKNSPWKGGKGDIVGELAAALRRAGMKFGVYLSPWDRNSALYGKPEYVTMYREQLRELLTQYGPIFEVWHDGANGGSGYYGGARETRRIDRATYYDWERTWKLERSLQPDAVIWCEIGPDIRWVGNEAGHANETCWATYTPHGRNGRPPAPRGFDGERGGSHRAPRRKLLDAPGMQYLHPARLVLAPEGEQSREAASATDGPVLQVGRARGLLPVKCASGPPRTHS